MGLGGGGVRKRYYVAVADISESKVPRLYNLIGGGILCVVSNYDR